MPVTAKLSKAFYERLGHELTDELVDYLNQVDAAYRNDLRELNELNFARFDAKLEQRVTELRSEIAAAEARVRSEIGAVKGELLTAVVNLEKDLVDRLGSQRADILKWNVVLWISAIFAIVGIR